MKGPSTPTYEIPLFDASVIAGGVYHCYRITVSTCEEMLAAMR